MSDKKELPKLEDLLKFYEELRTNPTFFKMAGIKQHRTSNTYRHVCMVTEESLYYAYNRKLDVDYYSLIRGAYLHDLFLYDWRKEGRKACRKNCRKACRKVCCPCRLLCRRYIVAQRRHCRRL
mgnify:CR=1 FL=1